MTTNRLLLGLHALCVPLVLFSPHTTTATPTPLRLRDAKTYMDNAYANYVPQYPPDTSHASCTDFYKQKGLYPDAAAQGLQYVQGLANDKQSCGFDRELGAGDCQRIYSPPAGDPRQEKGATIWLCRAHNGPSISMPCNDLVAPVQVIIDNCKGAGTNAGAAYIYDNGIRWDDPVNPAPYVFLLPDMDDE